VARRAVADEEFTGFVNESYAGLVRFGTLLVGERARGEDIVQTALMKVYGAWPRIEDKQAARAYTHTTMVRLAERGRRRRWRGEQPTAIEPDAVIAIDRTDEVVLADAVRRALATLPLGQRAVLVLRYFEMCAEAEVAEILGISVGTVKSRAARGLAALRQLGLLAEPAMAWEEAG
jgi:RNA polymerase sigma-70 factor (sigma-E family)